MRKHILFSGFCLCFVSGFVSAGAPDVSDTAIETLLAGRFQYDYTTIVDDATLRDFIDALDYQLAVIEYRQRMELIGDPKAGVVSRRYGQDLKRRHLDLLGDPFVFKKFTDWNEKTADPVNRAFIDWYLTGRSELLMDPSATGEARKLAQRIGDRLYGFHFRINGQKYSAADAAEIIFSGDNAPLAETLYRMLNDSASILAEDATRLYTMYNNLGQHLGYRTSLDFHLAKLSFRRPEWLIIADNMAAISKDEYFLWLEDVKQARDQENIPLFEIEEILSGAAVLPDSFFTPEAVSNAMERLLTGMGLGLVHDRLRVRTVDSAGYAALAVRLCPPYDNLLLDNREGGFAYYRRLAAELGRSLPWVYADTTLPYVLRDYPAGSEEALTLLFEMMALEAGFLAEQFSIPADKLDEFERNYRRLTAFRIRQSLLYFYFDYYLSQEIASDPVRLYLALQDSLFGVRDSSYQWIEILVTGGLESAPEKLAHRFIWARTAEMLHRRFGDRFFSSPAAGAFLIEEFCLPGRTRTIEQYVDASTDDRLSVDYFKSVMGFR